MPAANIQIADGTGMEGKNRSRTTAPALVKLLSIVLFAIGIFALAGSTFLWGQGFIFRPPGGVDVTLPTADILINAPASILAAIGLWRLRHYGYLAAYFVAGIYLYASTFILMDVLLERPPNFWAIFAPQLLAVLIALALLFYLPRIRHLFC